MSIPASMNSPLLGYHGRNVPSPPVGYNFKVFRSKKRRRTSAASEWLRAHTGAPGRHRKVRLALTYVFYTTATCIVGLFVFVWLSHRADAARMEPEHILNRLAKAARLPHHLQKGRQRPTPHVAWVGRPPPAQGIDQAWLTKPYDKFRWTFLHATIREQRDTYQSGIYGGERYLQILGFIEETPPYRQPNTWQLGVEIGEMVTKITCSYALPNLGVWAGEGSIRYQFPTRAWGLFVHCPLPPALPTVPPPNVGPINAALDIGLDDAPDFHYTFTLESTAISPPPVTSPLGICLAPAYGELDERTVLEWRMHHWLMGFLTVHWYDRTQGAALEKWVQKWNAVTGAKDTWGAAPPVSPETYGADFLEDHGKSGDQVLYYMDCQARARTTHPTEWLAFTDLDEWHLPSPFPSEHRSRSKAPSVAASAALSSFYSSHNGSVGSICIGRTQPFGPEIGHPPSFWDLDGEHDSDPLRLASIAHQRPPYAWDARDNYKCVHRNSALEVAFVHWPITYFPYPDQDAEAFQEVFIKGEQTEDHSVRLLHMSQKREQDGDITPFPLSAGLVRYLGELNEARRTIAQAMDWPCTTIPCR